MDAQSVADHFWGSALLELALEHHRFGPRVGCFFHRVFLGGRVHYRAHEFLGARRDRYSLVGAMGVAGHYPGPGLSLAVPGDSFSPPIIRDDVNSDFGERFQPYDLKCSDYPQQHAATRL